jgi:hypothetical protein
MKDCVFLPLLAGFLLCAAAPGQARGAGDPVRVPFETHRGAVVVPVSINGSRPLNCVLDTGMTRGVFLMNPETGKELGLRYVQQVMVGGAGEGEPRYGEVATGVTFEIAGVIFEDQNALVLTENPPYMDRRFEGIVGKTVFDQYVVEIDFESREVVLHDPAGWDSTGAGEWIPIELSYTKPFVDARVRIDNSHEIPVSLVVDLGAGHALSLNRNQDPKLPTPGRTVTSLLGTGIKGDVIGEQGRIRSLRIGSFEMAGVVTSFPENTDEAGLGPIARNGNLGIGVLKRFTVTFDYGNRGMYLRPNDRFATPFEVNMAGLSLRHVSDGGLSVYYVRKYSPAFKAGIVKGDTVLSVDGRPAADWDDVLLEERLQREGEAVDMVLRSGDREYTVTFALERQL